jgi:hypothetical protein
MVSRIEESAKENENENKDCIVYVGCGGRGGFMN